MEKRFCTLESELSQLKKETAQLRKGLNAQVLQLRKANRDLNGEVLSLQKQNRDLWNEIFQLKGPRLIPDIFPHINEALIHDRPTLKSCALVCRDWHHATRPLLFRRIVHEEHLTYSGVRKTIDYLPLLRDPLCTIFSHVQVVQFDGVGSGFSGFSGLSRVATFLGHAKKFRVLRRIEFTAMFLDSRNHALLEGVRHRITEIELNYTSFQSMRDFTHFVSIFDSLRVLSLYVSAHLPHDLTAFFANSVDLARPPPTLGKLCFSCGYGGNFATAIFQWLYDTQHGLHAMEIDWRFSGPEVAEVFQKYITFLGASLSELNIAGYLNTFQVALSDAAEVNTGLRQVEIYCAMDFAAQQLSADERVYLPTSGIPIVAALPPSVECIRLDIGVWHCDPGGARVWSGERWTLLDGILNGGGKFPALREVDIMFKRFSTDVDEQLRQVWPQLLPLCAAKRILKVTVYTPRDFK
ncbi:hypothetical protein D9615_003411 [Tricholomella constricta]|uniref:F-box domain-containing protein n=1 Tax=Tricholomella constricta TaxID=117010 RepID=A0A8H5HJ77_9AGAR|nr:hypothetical protein D9615_003411 [Tricholomella constricta]